MERCPREYADQASLSLELRRRIEDVLEKAALLGARDAAILRMYLERGASFREIGCVAGVSEKAAARRIRRLIGRLRTWRCVRMAGFTSGDPSEMAMARGYVVTGLTLRELAQAHGCCKGKVAMVLSRVEAATGVRIVNHRRRRRERKERN
jgi:hypothetical protein